MSPPVLQAFCKLTLLKLGLVEVHPPSAACVFAMCTCVSAYMCNLIRASRIYILNPRLHAPGNDTQQDGLRRFAQQLRTMQAMDSADCSHAIDYIGAPGSTCMVSYLAMPVRRICSFSVAIRIRICLNDSSTLHYRACSTVSSIADWCTSTSWWLHVDVGHARTYG